MTVKIPPILLVGLGKMGGAMLAGWQEQGLEPSVAIDPSLPSHPGITIVASAADIPPNFSPAAVVLAVKPQNAADTVPLYAKYAPTAVMLSLMAGQTLQTLHKSLTPTAAIVRSMPNTPAAIRQAITVAVANSHVSAAQKALCDNLLTAIGDVAWVDDETLIDAVTAVSVCGPAYVFLLAELLEAAAIEQGIPPALARQLARKTIAGSGALLQASPQNAATLRINVTSPKGTTEQALAILMAPTAWPLTISNAIAAATARSRELAG